MFIENLSYIATFIVTSGIAVIGILTTYQIYQLYKKPELSSLLYQQIFLFSFFVYGIWGNISLHEILADLNLSVEISNKLMFFIPLIGLPFLIVSWFMLLKFAFNVNGYGLSRSFILSYFSAFFALLFAFIFLIQKKIVLIPENPDVFIVRAIVAFNLIMHIVFFIPFLFQKTNSKLKEISLNKEWIYFYLAGVICYSAALSFFNSFGFISTCVSIIILFGVSVMVPIRIKLNNFHSDPSSLDFNSFCELFDISKREAEIIIEICSGKTNKDIADKLFITLQTVKDHNHRIFTKTGVKSRVQLANLVREKTGQL